MYEDRERSRPEARVWRVVVVGPDGRRRSERVRGSKREAFDVRDRLRTEAAATVTASGLPRPPRGGRTWTVETWLEYWKMHGRGRPGGHPRDRPLQVPPYGGRPGRPERLPGA